MGATGVGISAILNHGRTFITNQGHEQGTPGNPSASLLSAKTPSTESPEWEHPIVPRDERPPEESNYLEMGGDKYKSMFAKKLERSSRYEEVKEPLDAQVTAALTGLGCLQLSEEDSDEVHRLTKRAERLCRSIVY